MSEEKHSRLPWSKSDVPGDTLFYDANGWSVPPTDENIDFIVRACNAFPAMKAALEAFRSVEILPGAKPDDLALVRMGSVLDALAALSLAKGEE